MVVFLPSVVATVVSVITIVSVVSIISVIIIIATVIVSVVIIIRCLIVHKPSTCISLVINTLIICNKKRKINILFENFSYPF